MTAGQLDFDLKYGPKGRHRITISKGTQFVGARYGLDLATRILKACERDHDFVPTGHRRGGFEIFQLAKAALSADGIDEVLTKLRAGFPTATWTWVYHLGGRPAERLVPTGLIFVRFKASVTPSAARRLLKSRAFNLEIVDRPGPYTGTVWARTTASSGNPVRVAQALQQLDDRVALAEPDFDTDVVLHSPGNGASAQAPKTRARHLKQAGVPKAWKLGVLGAPEVRVGVVDFHFNILHPAFAAPTKVLGGLAYGSGIVPQVNLNAAAQNQKNMSQAQAVHGTACASIAAGSELGNQMQGAAPNCTLVPIGLASADDAEVISWLELADRNDIAVVSCSWQRGSTLPLSETLDAAIAHYARHGRGGKGIVICFSAGNDDECIDVVTDAHRRSSSAHALATHPDVIAVAACADKTVIWKRSNYGRNVCVCAPCGGKSGKGMWTATLNDAPGAVLDATSGASYTKEFGGTSGANALVAGICALMLSANPKLRPADVRKTLQATATAIDTGSAVDSQGRPRYFGVGRVNADLAVKMANPALG